jgi:hypothetical protein
MHTGQKGRLTHPYDLTFNYQIARSTDRFQRQPPNILRVSQSRQVASATFSRLFAQRHEAGLAAHRALPDPKTTNRSFRGQEGKHSVKIAQMQEEFQRGNRRSEMLDKLLRQSRETTPFTL